MTENTGTKACTSWIERSVNKGKTWTTLAKRVVPHTTPDAFAKTGDYYDGPGNLAKPCLRYGTGKTVCGTAVTLKASKAKDAGGALPVSYERTFAAAPCDGASPRFVTNLVPNIVLGGAEGERNEP